MTMLEVRLARPPRFRMGLLTKLWLVWFSAYAISGAVLGQTFLTGTVDRIDPGLVYWVILNIPLQLSLILLAELASLSPKRVSAVASRLFAGAAVGLALMHLVVSLATWW